MPIAKTLGAKANKIGEYLTSLLKKTKAKPDGDEVPTPDGQTPDPDGPEPDIPEEPTGPPQIAPEGSPDTSLNVPRAMELVEDFRDQPRPAIASEGRPDDGNLNLKTLGDDPRVKQVADLLNEGQDRFRERASRQKVSTGESMAASEDIKVMQRAINKRWDSAWTHEEILSLGTLNKEVTILLKEKADELIVAIDNGTISGSEEIAFAYLESMAISVQQKMTDAAAASGRSLQAFKKLQDASSSMEYQQATREIIELQGGAEALRERIKMYAHGETLADMYKAKTRTPWGQAKEVIMKVRYNMMLASFRTHAANITGSSFYTAYENLWIQPLASVFNKFEQVGRAIIPFAPDMKPNEVMYLRESWASTSTFIDGITEGFGKGWRVFLGKEKDIGPTKLSVEGPGRMSHATVPKSAVGKVATTPTRALEAEDVAARVINSHAHLARLAYREARTLSTNARDAKVLFREFMEHPPEHLRKEAQTFGERASFIQDPKLDSRLLATLAEGVAYMQNRNMVVQNIVPFVRSPANLMIYAKNNLGLSSRMVTDYFSQGAIQRAEWNARLVSATGLFFLTKNWYDKGLITGVGNPNQAIRRAENATGMNPMNSLKFNDKWYQLNRLDPAALSIGILATLHEQMDYYEGDQKASMDGVVGTTLEISKLMLDRSMLSGISQVMEVMTGASSASTKGDVVSTVGMLPSLVTPGILRDVRMAQDPTMRQMEPEGSTVAGMYQRIWKRWSNSIPGFSNDLPPKRNWRGDIKDYQGNMFYRALVPVAITKPMDDRSSAALVQFGVGISKVQPKFAIPQTGIPLNTMEIDDGRGFAYDKLQEFVGISRASMIDKIVNTSSFTRLTDSVLEDGRVSNPAKYEKMSESLSLAMSAGRRQGVMAFLEWVDGKTEIPGPIVDGKRTMIPITKVVSRKGVEGWEAFAKGYYQNQPFGSEIYELPKRTVSPGAQDLIDF
jgi:hypothetical protein